MGTRRGRGRPKKYWGEVITHEIVASAYREMPVDRRLWRTCIRIEG